LPLNSSDTSQLAARRFIQLRLQYKEDFIEGILWRWQYEPETGKKPRDLTPHCPECFGKPQMMRLSHPPIGIGFGGNNRYTLTLTCPHTFKRYNIIADYQRGDYAYIEDAIDWKIKSGEYKDVLKQRRDRWPF
jgi:hypothetical protein